MTTPQLTTLRRNDREITAKAAIEAILQRATVGRLGLARVANRMNGWVQKCLPLS